MIKLIRVFACIQCCLLSISTTSTGSQEQALVSNTLYLAGNFQGLTAPKSIATREELAELAGAMRITATLIPRSEPAELTVLPFAALLDAYPFASGADGLVLETHNGWESFLPLEHIEKHGTVLLLYYDGKTPEEKMWPMFGGNIEPLAPFYAFDPDDPIPNFVSAPKFGMIAATQIKGIRAVETEERYAKMFLTEHSQLGQAGRNLFMQRCNGCHLGPGRVGGNVAKRPFEVLQAHANYNADYFRAMVVNPDQFFANTAMPANPDLEASDLEALLAFLKEAKP